MNFFYVLILSVVAVNAQRSKAKDPKPIVILNPTEFVDRVLTIARDRIISTGFNEIHPRGFQLSVRRENAIVDFYNQSLVGLANVYRVGDVTEQTDFSHSKMDNDHTKYRSPLAVYNVSSDTDFRIKTDNSKDYTEGHVHLACDNVTAHQAIRQSNYTQPLALSEFWLSVGDCSFDMTGAESGSAVETQILKVVKRQILELFTFKLQSALVYAVCIERGQESPRC